MQAPTLPSPSISPESAAYWQAANDGRLLLRRCTACGQHHHYPRAFCPYCMSDKVKWVEASGAGTIYSFTVIRRGPGAGLIPAFVTLREGPTMMSGLVQCAPGDVRIGQSVTVQFVASENGQRLPMFTPAHSS
jgi:uncharacterized protein